MFKYPCKRMLARAMGRELAERLEGIGVADFYGPYLDERLRTARAQLGQRR